MNAIYRSLRNRLRFYRHHRPFELQWARVYYAQYGEDIVMAEYFRGMRDGFYVEVGAFHPILYSNTYRFYKAGWHGITIEPNPLRASLFRRCRPRDIMIQCAISADEGTARFAIDGEYSGIDGPQYPHKDRTQKAEHIDVPTRPLRAVLDEHLRSMERGIDILSVDTEGHDYIVLTSNDWTRFRPLLAVCEAFDAETAAQLRELFHSVRYRLLAHCGPSMIFEDTDDRPGPPRGYY